MKFVAKKRKLAIYCVDQDKRTTSTLGVYNSTKGLIHALAQTTDPGIEIVLWLSEANIKDFKPERMPPWMDFRCLPGSYDRRYRRLCADHLLVHMLSMQDSVDTIHFPKGYLPFFPTRKVHTVVTMHDAITRHYITNRLKTGNRLKLRYFDFIAAHSLRHADAIITSSRFSANDLAKVVHGCRPKTRIIPAFGMPMYPSAKKVKPGGYLVIGSKMPHKATAETLHLLDAYAHTKHRKIAVTVTGITDWADISTDCLPSMLKIDFTGRVSNKKLAELMDKSRALILLSTIEGFGLPVIEAYSRLTPVCYRNSSSLEEVLEGVPGGWDSKSKDTFCAALDSVIGMTQQEIKRIANRLKERYNWNKITEQTIEVYHEVMNSRK